MDNVLLKSSNNIEQGAHGVKGFACHSDAAMSCHVTSLACAALRSNCARCTRRYQVRLDAARTRDTQLLFVTTGILLRYLAIDALLPAFSHVIVDEVRRGMAVLQLCMEILRGKTIRFIVLILPSP